MQPDSKNKYQLVFTTCPNEAVAEKIALALVQDKIAACVNIVGGVKSIYRWQGKIEQDNEALLLIKSDTAHYEQLEKRILALHPYELPEILAVTLDTGAKAYLNWITTCLD
jgi:periplasmic divalent cation tolerance protein